MNMKTALCIHNIAFQVHQGILASHTLKQGLQIQGASILPCKAYYSGQCRAAFGQRSGGLWSSLTEQKACLSSRTDTQG